MRPVYEEPKIQRHIFCHELMENDEYKYGILTRKPLPPVRLIKLCTYAKHLLFTLFILNDMTSFTPRQICEFPTYSDLGEVRVTIQVNAETLRLSEEQLEDVSKFHRTLFLDIMEVVPKCFMYDNEEDSNGYFVVPLRLCKFLRR